MYDRHRHRDPRHPMHPAHAEFGRHGFHRGRGRGGGRARRGDVRAAVLALLADRPMHGYEMIKEIEERSGGAWTPSAGSIYPTLQLLEDAGLIRGEEIDGRRRFTLTDEGRAELRSREEAEAPWDAVRADAPSERIELQGALRKLMPAIAQVMKSADGDQQRKVGELLDETRRRIYAILAEG